MALNVGDLVLQISAQIEGFDKVPEAVQKLSKEMNKAVKTQEKLDKANKKVSKSVKPMHTGMSELAKTATVALGPLNGVASRITALTSIAKASAIPMAILLGGIASFAVITGKSIVAGAKFESSLMLMQNALRGFGKESEIGAIKLNKVAVGLAETTLTSTAFAREAAIALQGFSGIGDNTERVLYLAQDLTETFGGSLLRNTKRLGKVFEDPIYGLQQLTEVGIRFTRQEKEVIESLVLTGRASEASGKILDKVNSRVGGNATKAAKGLAGAWDTMGERITAFIEKIGGVGTKGGALAKVITEISDQLKEWTNQAGLAESIGESVGAVLKGMANIALFLAKNIGVLTSAMVGLAVGGIANRLIPSLKAATIALFIQKTATDAVTGSVVRLTVANRILSAVMKLNPFAIVVGLVATLAAKMLLFGDNTEEAVASQKKMNKAANEGAESLRKLHAALTPSESAIKANKDLLAQLKDELRTVKEEAAKNNGEIIRSGVTLNAAAEVIRLEATIKALETQLKSIRKEESLRKLGNDVSLVESEFIKLQGTIIKGADAQAKFKKALDVSQGLQNVVAQTRALTAEETNFIDAVEQMRQKGGAFIEVADKVNKVKTALDRANQIAAASKADFFGTGQAVDALNKSFSYQDSIKKWTDEFSNSSTERRKFTADLLDINTAGLSQAQVVERIAMALSAMESKAGDAGESLKKAMDFKTLAPHINNIIGGMQQLVAAQLSAFQELASYHKQQAQEALNYGKQQSEMWMQLADTVHYSNNAQAKSFEDRAIMAAEASAKEYQAQKAAQAKANASAKKAFENQKSLQIAQALMSTASAVANALGSLPPPANVILASAMGALGAAQVAMISRQQYTPREKGGSITGGKPYLVGEAGPELIVPGAGGTVVNNGDLMAGIGNGGETNINFNIQALDAKDATKIIYENRGMIINIVKQAQNEKMGVGL